MLCLHWLMLLEAMCSQGHIFQRSIFQFSEPKQRAAVVMLTSLARPAKYG